MPTSPQYDVHLHASGEVSGEWLRFRFNGYCYFPMKVLWHEIGLRSGRFSHFVQFSLLYSTTIGYDVDNENSTFADMIEWIAKQNCAWNFCIFSKGNLEPRRVVFSFDDLRTAVAFKLTWG
jgi:hypothetical protein